MRQLQIVRPGWLPVAARILVFVLCVGAVALIVAIAAGSGVSSDRMSGQVIYSAIFLILYSLIAAAGVELTRRRKGKPMIALGYLTVAVALIALGVTVHSIWTNYLLFFGIDKATGYSLLFGLGSGGAAVLLCAGSGRTAGDLRLSRAGALLGLTTMVLLAFVELAFSNAEISPQVFAIAAIVFGLGTVSLALLTVAVES